MKKRFITTAVILLVIASAFMLTVYTYDSENDPVISLSYLKEVFAPSLKEEIYSTVGNFIPQSGASGATYEILELSDGQTLKALGTVEIILRPGGGALAVSQNELGLSDITDGAELLNGMAITENHYVIIPRGDGRGVMATADKTFIMVRGEFEIE